MATRNPHRTWGVGNGAVKKQYDILALLLSESTSLPRAGQNNPQGMACPKPYSSVSLHRTQIQSIAGKKPFLATPLDSCLQGVQISCI